MAASYLRVFRPVFVVFSLYLMGDAFFRWDGFSYYAPLYDFVVSLSLAYLFSSIFAFVTVLIVWLLFRLFEWICGRLGLKFGIDHMLLTTFVCVLIGAITWKVKTVFWSDILTTFQLKAGIFIVVVLASLLIVWLFRNRVEQWLDAIQEKITPLVWLYGILVPVSVLIVVFNIAYQEVDRPVLQKTVQSEGADIERPNILLVTYDAMSARDMSVYGYKRETTPFISEWSGNASVFARAEAVSNYTAPTTATLMTGKNVWTHRRFNRMQGSKPVRTDVESLTLSLKQHGYYNMMFMANIIGSAQNLGISNSVDYAPSSMKFWNITKPQGRFSNLMISLFADKFRIYNWLLQEDFIIGKLVRRFESDESVTRFPPELAFNSFIDYVSENPQTPFFAWIHLDPPHYPYLPPEPFMGMFDEEGGMKTLKTQSEGKLKIMDHVLRHNRFPREIETLRARYDEFIRYSDEQFKGFIGQLEMEGLLDNTVVMLSADHGETFEHNSLLHGRSLFEPETNIPLIVKEPNAKDGRRIRDVVSQKDIPATILDLAGIPVPTWMEGQSLVPFMRGNKVSLSPPISVMLEQNRTEPSPITRGTIAVWEGSYKLIHDLDKDRSMLFDLDQDPSEVNDLIEKEPETADRLLELILKALEKANEKIVSGE